MKISIFGLGYVGCVSAGCLARNGHIVIGVDVNETKINLINKGISPIVESQINDIIKNAVKNKLLTATSDSFYAIKETDISIVCVGTPNLSNGHLDLRYIFNTINSIGEGIKNKNSFHTIIIRSTVPPGTNNKVSSMIAHISSKKEYEDFGVVSNPEFLREGNAVEDYYNPPYTIVGTKSEIAYNVTKEIYNNINAPLIRTSIEVAEIIKYVSNSFHALKITFANEIGNLCNATGINAEELMDIFCKDSKLNISSVYLKPGMAYGGSCLPKDLLALNRLALDYYLDLPLIFSIEKSNEVQKLNTFKKVTSYGKRRIGLIGLSFKYGTDDLRYSPAVDLVERLIGKGYRVKIYDQNVNYSRLIGKNKSFIDEKLPHLSSLLCDDIDELIKESDLIVFTQRNSEVMNKCKKLNKLYLKFFI